MHGKHIFKKLCMALAATLVLLSPCYAVDGVIEVNQAIVEDSGGFPFEIEESGSYRLTGDLVVEETETGGILVVGPIGVTIDLNGFSIIGPGAPKSKTPGTHRYAPGSRAKGMNPSIGIFGDNIRLTILNGKITGFATGIFTYASSQVKMVRVVDNRAGMVIMSSDGSLVENCEVVNNFFGMFAFRGVVRDSNLSRNDLDGLACADCTISDNIVANNGEDGIDCFDIDKGKFPENAAPTGCTISNNQVRGNGGAGIRAAASLVTGNTIIDGGDSALSLDDFSGWSNNVIQDTDVGSLTPAKGAFGNTFPGIGGWIIDCNLVNTETFCWPFHID